MNSGEIPRTGTIRLPDPVEHRRPWPLVVVAILIVVGLGWWFTHRGPAEDPMQKAVALRDASEFDAATQMAEERLKAAGDKDEARPWRDFLAETYVRAKKPEKAKPHYHWLAQNYPKEAKYKKALKSLGATPKPSKPKK